MYQIKIKIMLDSYKLTQCLIITTIVIIGIILIGITLTGGISGIFIGLQALLTTPNPFYVVASGSMMPVLNVYDVLVVQSCFNFWGFSDSNNCFELNDNNSFEDIEVGDIIVFHRPSDHNRIIVHRVVEILEDDPKTIRTKGDSNPGSIPGTDFPITEHEYIGKVVYVAPQLGYVTQFLKPPVNYLIIAGMVIISWIFFKIRINNRDFLKLEI